MVLKGDCVGGVKTVNFIKHRVKQGGRLVHQALRKLKWDIACKRVGPGELTDAGGHQPFFREGTLQNFQVIGEHIGSQDKRFHSLHNTGMRYIRGGK